MGLYSSLWFGPSNGPDPIELLVEVLTRLIQDNPRYDINDLHDYLGQL